MAGLVELNAQIEVDPASVAGTAWTFCRPELKGLFDLLVVDEAGQMALANLLVMARCARSILLVGDQQRLAQPSQADHPGESGLSCFDYLIQDAAVVPPDRGVFLATSWRMEPSLATMVSALFYDGRLQAPAANRINAIAWSTPFIGSDGDPLPHRGLTFMAVEHRGCGVLGTGDRSHRAARGGPAGMHLPPCQ